MSQRSDLPPELESAPFRTVAATELGVTASRLRSSDLDRSYWGVRSVRPLVELSDRCRALQRRMPGHSFFSHSTAALLHGMPLPREFEISDHLHVSVRTPHRAPHANRIRGHSTSAPVSVVEIAGIRVCDPARTWCDLATKLRLEDLVAAGDFGIHWRHPITTSERLLEAMQTATSRRGKSRLDQAWPLLDQRAESAPESRLRVLLTKQGFTGLEIDRHVEDRYGEFVARTDVYIPQLKVVVEYMGDYHRTSPGQWRADMTRRTNVELTGKRVLEINADDLRYPRDLARRIRQLATLVPH